MSLGPESLVEDGVALIARGMFRSVSETGDHSRAVEMAEAAVSTLTEILMDFRRNAAKERTTK